MADLDREFAVATDGITPLLVERFKRMGIPNRIIYGPRHYLGVARITTTPGLFEFHEDGEVALVVPEGEPEVPACHLTFTSSVASNSPPVTKAPSMQTSVVPREMPDPWTLKWTAPCPACPSISTLYSGWI